MSFATHCIPWDSTCNRCNPPRSKTAQLRIREKDVEHQGDLLMLAAGFTAIRFSQPRNTMQTPGIPDRRYYRYNGRSTMPQYDPARHHMVWWEAKAPKGKQSVHQKAFQQLVESCGETYLCGGTDVLVEYLAAHGIGRRTG